MLLATRVVPSGRQMTWLPCSTPAKRSPRSVLASEDSWRDAVRRHGALLSAQKEFSRSPDNRSRRELPSRGLVVSRTRRAGAGRASNPPLSATAISQGGRGLSRRRAAAIATPRASSASASGEPAGSIGPLPGASSPTRPQRRPAAPRPAPPNRTTTWAPWRADDRDRQRSVRDAFRVRGHPHAVVNSRGERTSVITFNDTEGASACHPGVAQHPATRGFIHRSQGYPPFPPDPPSTAIPTLLISVFPVTPVPRLRGPHAERC